MLKGIWSCCWLKYSTAIVSRKYDVITEVYHRINEKMSESSVLCFVNQIQAPGQGPISSMLTCSYADRREMYV